MEDDDRQSGRNSKKSSGGGSSKKSNKPVGSVNDEYNDRTYVNISRDDDAATVSNDDGGSAKSKGTKGSTAKEKDQGKLMEPKTDGSERSARSGDREAKVPSTPPKRTSDDKRETAKGKRKTGVLEDDDSAGGPKIFRVTNPEIIPLVPKEEGSNNTQPRSQIRSASISSKGRPPSTPQPPPPPSSVEEEFYEYESLDLEPDEMSTFEDGEEYSYLDYESREGFEDDEEEEIVIQRSRGSLLREKWEKISLDVIRTFNSPSRVYKLRGYHSEPDLSLPFEDKFDPKIESSTADESNLRKVREKFVSCEDIAHLSGTEHPDLVRGVLSEVKLRSYAIDENMKNSWWELYEWERKRYSFFDELFAMGYVVDSLEVLSTPPKDADGKPISKGEYFVEAEEKHYRKKVDYGRVVFKTKHVYTGNFQDWYFEGPGRYCWQDGTVYQGEFSNGLMHGPGSIHWPDGCIYEGHFIYGKRTGWGVYSSADGQNTYAGEWLNGLPHGHGKMWYDPEDDDNDYYEGQWARGLPQGVGTRQYSTGDRYVGNWQEGMRNGYGIMIWLQERQVYKGEWLDGVPNGFGKHIWYLERSPSNSFPTRHVYQGNWVMGRREGVGKMVYPCGSVYEGKWKNGQRHGKGMFINPAGDILVGLFRAGSILGGSDVPLHAPTYECDYAGLTEWLTAKFHLPLREDNFEEEQLLEITKQYLPYFRKLYHRAGEYSHYYGKHGLYPAYLKKTSTFPGGDQKKRETNEDSPYQVHRPREYSRLDEPEHMKGKVDKPEPLDGINPVTRFGLWLLLRDCDNVLEEATMAYYDKIWCETPPLSFQTRHNPFEPVYLWQFLQALIVASVAYFIDIPRLRQHAAEKAQTQMEPPAVSDTTLQSGISFAEHRRAVIARQHRNRAGMPSKSRPLDEDQPSVSMKKSHHYRKTKSMHAGKEGKDKEKKHHHKKHGGDAQQEEQDGDGNPTTKPSTSMDKDPLNKTEGENVGTKKKSGVMDKRKSNADALKRRSQLEKEDKNSQDSKGKASVSSKKKKNEGRNSSSEEPPAPPEEDTVSSKGYEPEEEEEVSSEEEEEFLGEGEEGLHRTFSVHFQKGEEEETELPFQPSYSISECFENFLSKKLLPCLRREPGSNLPAMPQPLPALVDMYDAFKGIKQRDIIKGKEFLRSALPHLMFPSAKDALWWHRCPEPLSHQVDIDDLLEMFREKFDSVEEELPPDDNFEEKFESEYLGAQAQNSEITLRLLRLCKENPTAPECPVGANAVGITNPTLMPVVDSEDVLLELKESESEDLAPLADFITEGNPFAEDELVPEPFLWADDYKCIPVRRKYQHFENINTQDIFSVIRQLYPKLCTGKHEKDLQFELIFCDWLWCTSLLAKTSTAREIRDAWKTKSETRPITNPQSLGVYAHYVKLIKNNPYLSPNPPPDFQPKRKPKPPPENEEKKAVKFL